MEIHLKYIPPVIADQQHQVTGDLADCWDREKGEMGEEWIAKRKSPPTGRPGSPCYHVGCDPVPAVANNGTPTPNPMRQELDQPLNWNPTDERETRFSIQFNPRKISRKAWFQMSNQISKYGPPSGAHKNQTQHPRKKQPKTSDCNR